MRLTLPFPPSVNTYWRSFRGRNILSEKAREYKGKATAHIIMAGWPVYKGPCRLKIVLFPPDNRRRDSDNYNKPLFDCLVENKVIEADDSRIVKGHSVEWAEPDKTNPRVEIEIEGGAQ